MSGLRIYRYAYVPEYTKSGIKMTKLKVIKIICNTVRVPLSMASPRLIYVLENSMRIPNDHLITKPPKDQQWMMNKFINYRSLNNFGVIRRHKTIWSPVAEIEANQGGYLEELITSSEKEIKWCIDNDVIYGEKDAREYLKYFKNRNNA